MAQAESQHTSTDWRLTDLFHYLRAELGYKKKRALYEMEYRRARGHLWVKVQEYDADGQPQGDPFDLGTDKKNELVYDGVWVHPLGLPSGDFRCSVTEQNARALWPGPRPASETAPDQQPEDSASPAFNTGADGRPTAVNQPTVTLTRKKRQSKKETRVIEILRALDLKCRVRDDMEPAEVEKIVKPHYVPRYGEISRRAIDRAYKKFLEQPPAK